MREAAHSGQYHTKAVKKRHTDTTFIFGSKFHVYAGQITVIDYVVMGEHHAFGKTGSAGGVLHIHHILTRGQVSKPDQLIIFHIISQQQNFGGVVHAAVFFLSNVHHVFQFGEPFAFEFATLSGFQLWHQIVNNVGIVISGHSVGHTKGVHIGVFQ